ncbi:MAG: hypothetical protein LBV07_03885 [Syntrophobacterales bacterium]|nr:hypothetical protein [Syntrophobacterales bacterium]
MVFSTISIVPPRDKIYQRLGCRREITQLTGRQEKLTDSFIDEAASFIALKGAALRIPIAEHKDGVVLLAAEEIYLKSAHLAAFLCGCTEVLLMGATAGHSIAVATQDSMEKGAAARAAVFDAAASEMTDGALEWLMNYHRRSLLREGKNLLTKRYSAGYGDFALENQRHFYKLLDLGAIDVQITADHILLPEKSVTAITGIRKL